MFDCITFGRDSLVEVDNLGELAECLLYYKQVHVIVDHGSFTRLARICGPETLFGLIEDGHLSLTYLENRPAVATQRNGGREEHGFVLVQGRGKQSQELVPQLFQELTGKQGRGRRLASKFLSRISTKTYGGADLDPSLSAIETASYTDRLVPELLAAIGISNLPDKIVFRVHKEKDSFIIDTNLDFVFLNTQYRQRLPDRSLDPGLILDLLYEGYAEVDFAASLASEMAPTPTESVIAQQRVTSVLQTRSKSVDRLTAFQDFVIPNAASVADAIDNRKRTFEDLRKLLGEAAPFKEWIRNQAPEADMAKAYVEEITKVSWRTGSVTKNLRFILFNAAQIAAGAAIAGPPGIVAGVALAAADTYLLDRLLAGWRPHQFVRGPLEKFLGGSQ
jgi:hypothetical protein